MKGISSNAAATMPGIGWPGSSATQGHVFFGAPSCVPSPQREAAIREATKIFVAGYALDDGSLWDPLARCIRTRLDCS